MMKKPLFLLLFSFIFSTCLPQAQHKNPANSRSFPKRSSEDLIKLIEQNKYQDSADKPSDPLLAILWKYSPDAYHLIRITENHLLKDIKIGNSVLIKSSEEASGKRTTILNDGTKKVEILAGKGFVRWIEPEKPFPIQIKNLSIAVHEENHGFTSRSAAFHLSKILKDTAELSTPSADGKMYFTTNFNSFYLDRNTILVTQQRSVRYSNDPVFPAWKIANDIPAANRTFRYKTYIDKSNFQSTHTNGISGLLDEYNSYYWSNKTIYDLFEFYKQEQPQTVESWKNWSEQIFSYYFAWAEFRYFILTYLLHAKKHEPNVYASLQNDHYLRRAFTAIDDRFTDLIKKIFVRLTKELPLHLQKMQIPVTMIGSKLQDKSKSTDSVFYKIGNHIQTMFLNYFHPLLNELSKKEFIETANQFRLQPQPALPRIEELTALVQK